VICRGPMQRSLVAREAAGDGRMAAALKRRILDEGLAMRGRPAGVPDRIGEIGWKCWPLGKAGKPIGILTHCNAGGLATVQYGRRWRRCMWVERGSVHVYSDETRPLLQGAGSRRFELKAMASG